MVVYKVVASHELPRFDPTKMVKDVLFSPANARVFSRVMRKYGAFISGSYFVGTLLFPVVVFAPASVAQYVSVVETVLEVPACVTALFTLRVDLVFFLVSSYDYWFFVSTTLVYTATFTLLLRDLRAMLIAARWIGFQLPILIDANVSDTKSMVVAVVVNIVLTFMAMVAVSLELMPDTTDSGASAGTTKRSLSARDLLANALFTMEILLIRIVIRKHMFSKSSNPIAPAPVKSGPPVPTIRCVTIRCLLKLDAVGLVGAKNLAGPQRPQDHAKTDQLRHTASSREYDSTDIVFPPLLRVSLHPRRCRLFHGVGILGAFLTMTCAAAMIISNHVTPSPLLITIGASATISTGSYLGVLLLFNNRQLLSSVCLSFDFLFLNLQISSAHACVCDMLRWRPIPTIAVGCMWLWMHWVLTLDALTPDMKQRLHFSHSRQIAVVFLSMYLFGQVAFLLMGIFHETWQLQNRAVISTKLLGHHLEFRVLPFFVSRMLTVTVWTVRLIYRFQSQNDPNKLIMLRGQVEFDYEPRMRSSALVRLTSIMPTSTISREGQSHRHDATDPSTE